MSQIVVIQNREYTVVSINLNGNIEEQIEEMNIKTLEGERNVKNEIIDNLRDVFYMDEDGNIFIINIFGDLQYMAKSRV